MESWFPGSMQRAHSINISSLSMIRRASIAVPQEVETFKKRVSSLSKEEKPDRCIHYFMKHFDSLSDSKLQTYGISSETARLVRHAWTFIDEYLSDMQKAIQIFQFLNSAIRIYLSAARTDQCFFKIIIRIAQTDDNDMIEAAIPFIQSALLKNELQKVFFSGQNLSSIWSNVFVKNINACLNLGPIFNSFASSYSITDVTVLLQLCEKVIEDLENNAVDPSSASSAFLFLGYMIRNTNTGDFLPSILERIREISLEVDNFQFFEPFIMAPTSDPPAIWSAIDSILADPQLPLELIESALLAIHNTGVPPSPEVFSFNSFIPRMFELDDNLQKKLFDVIGQSEKETKADFFYYVMPLSQSGINTEYLEKVSNGIIWGDFLLENIIQKFFIEPGLEEIQLCLVSDSHVFDIASDFIAQLPKFTPCATDLFNIFSELVLSGEETIEPLLKLMMMKADPSLYMNEIIANISMAYENDAIMNIYSEVCLNVLNFTEVFLQTENALESIPFFCEKSSGLDFLAALVVDGPIPEIDDFFSEHYHETTLNRLNREELTKLINGLSQNPQKRRLPQQQTIGSQSRLQNILRNTIINNQQHGFMRIPSLCPYIENIILETPVDQYIYGKVATQYFEPTNEQIGKFAIRYMSYELAQKITQDPYLLPVITDPNFHHHDLLQFHPAARNCSITTARSNSISFWFNIISVQQQTKIATCPGGSLILEENGYITFASRSVYITPKQWHLCTISTIEKTNKHSILIVCYIDSSKMGELSTNKTMTITFGSTDDCINQACWLMVPFIRQYPSPIDVNEMNKIRESGPQFPSQFRVEAQGGVKLVPYRGILKYMHLFGGPFYIFNLLLETENEEHFMLFLQSAFNLYRLGCYSKVHFFSNVRYVFLRQQQFFTVMIDQMLTHELEDKGKFDWKGFMMTINDNWLLSSPRVQFRIVLKVLKQYGCNLEDLSLFHTAIDTFLFFELDDETMNNILQVLDLYVKASQNLLKKIAMAIISLLFYDDDNPRNELLDERVLEKQRKLLQFLIQDHITFMSVFTCQDAFSIMAIIGDGLCVEFLHFISILCIENNDYFDLTNLKHYVPYLFLHVRNKLLWISLLQLLTRKERSEIEDFLLIDIARHSLLPIMFDLLTVLLPFEIQNYSPDCISFRILHFFYSMIQSQNISLFGLIANIQNICSLGFGERPISQYPFQLSKKVVVNRRASRPRVYKGNVDDYGDRAEHLYNHQVLIDLDPQLFEDMSNYMQYHPVNLDQFFDVNIPKVPDPEDFLTIVDSPIADLVSLIAAKALAEVGNDLSTFKKVVGPLTIFGADVVPKLAIEMHKKVILGLLDERDRISNDTLFFLIDFLTHRVIEGWWANKSTELLLKIIKLVPGFHKSLPKFIIACISQTQSSEGLMKMGNEIIKLSFFSSLISSMPNYTDALIYLFVNSEMIASESSTEFLKLFSSKINSSELAVAIDSHTLLDFLHNTDTEKMAEAYMTIYNELVQSATVNSNIISAERLDNTRKSRNQKIISTVRTIVSHLTYLRRAFRFQFFTRINKSCGMIERSINTLFTIKNLLHHSSEVPTKFCIVPASHPLTVPNKLIPKFFDYEAAYEKSETKVVVPKSRHNVNGCLVPELQGEITGPKCLDGWHLPPRAKVNIYSLFKSRFQAISEPFKCNFLIAPEMIPSVAVQSSNAIHIMLGSKFYNINKSNSNNKGKYYNIYLIDEYALSHFPIIENAMNRIYGDSTLFLGHVILNIPLSIVTLCIPRTFAYKQNAVDVFTAFGCHYTFIMTQSKRKSFVSQFNLISIPNSRRSFRFAQRLYSKSIESVSKMWANQLLSNYDYLLYLNMISGRSFNDFSQYPIFPWIISDYTTESPCIYRDLTKPMGQLDTTRAHHYDSIFSNTSPPYFYGTHYSNPASVLNFLVRIEPFTTYNVVLHGGFEQPDRMFNSLEETWKGASEQNPTDVRELIPELYSLTSLLYNINKINMHDKTDGTSTSSVVLPKWANDDPYLFIYHMRSALEDPAVSKEIQNWIDLIFGYKQRGNAAIEAKNVFHPLTYSDVTLDSDETVSRAQIDAILNFGQCPQQVFKEPHPARSNKPKNTLLNMDTKLYKIKKQIPNAVRIRVYDDELFVGKQFNHFLGSPPASVNVSDSAFVVNNRCLSIEPAFGISSSAQSNDNSYLAVGTNCGMILNYYMSQTHAFVLISKSLLPGEHFKVVSISSHYGLVFAATDDSLYLFDLTTGYLLRKLETSEPIILAEFDEVQDFIILATKSSIIVLSLEFDEIGYASASEFHEITALATCDDVVWCPTPYFATGHADGSILLWEISEVHKISATLLSFLNGKPITALKIYKSSHACLAIDEEGDAITVSIALLMKRILKPSCFEGCAVCKQTLSKSSLEKVISSSSGHSQSNSSANKDGISGNKSGIFSPLSMQQQSQKQQAQHYQQQQLQQQQQQQQIQKQMHMQHHLQHRLSQSNLQPGSLQYSAFQSGLKSSLFPLSKSGSNSNFNTNSSANTNSGTPNNNQGNTGKTFGSSYNPNSSLVNGENLNEELTKSNISPMPGSLSHVLPSDSNLSSSPIQNISSSNFPPIPSSIHQSNSGIAVHFQGVCALCGLPYCKKCAGTDKPNLCRACEQSEDAGMEYGVSRSMSSFGEGESVRTDFGFATGSPIIRKLSNF